MYVNLSIRSFDTTHVSQSLTPEQVEELHEDIEKYLRLEQSETNLEFWTVCVHLNS